MTEENKVWYICKCGSLIYICVCMYNIIPYAYIYIHIYIYIYLTLQCLVTYFHWSFSFRQKWPNKSPTNVAAKRFGCSQVATTHWHSFGNYRRCSQTSSHSLLHLDTGDTWKNSQGKKYASARRLLFVAMLESWPHDFSPGPLSFPPPSHGVFTDLACDTFDSETPSLSMSGGPVLFFSASWLSQTCFDLRSLAHLSSLWE